MNVLNLLKENSQVMVVNDSQTQTCYSLNESGGLSWVAQDRDDRFDAHCVYGYRNGLWHKLG